MVEPAVLLALLAFLGWMVAWSQWRLDVATAELAAARRRAQLAMVRLDQSYRQIGWTADEAATALRTLGQALARSGETLAQASARTRPAVGRG